jgi:hypothetical protein
MAQAINLISAVPEGMPGPEHFAVASQPAPTLGDGILVELLTLSVSGPERSRADTDLQHPSATRPL